MEKNRHATNGGFQSGVSPHFKYLGINSSLSKFSEIYLNEILKSRTQFPKLECVPSLLITQYINFFTT